MRPSPLQNRVNPLGEIMAEPHRGSMMGNRGGALHDAHYRLQHRRWISRQWICCLTAFSGRQRQIMAPNRYTELFFLDEATALAAGHRPCFECRRADAVRFARAWSEAAGLGAPARAHEIDLQLHAERLLPDGSKRLHQIDVNDLPDGTMILLSGSPLPRLLLGDRLLGWSFAGYQGSTPRPRSGTVQAVTPPSTVRALKTGYMPALHETAGIPG